MKTQFLTLMLILTFSINLLAADKDTSYIPDNLKVNELNWMNQVEEDETLSIEPWMINDALWTSNSSLSNLDNVSEDDELKIEAWMTDSSLWESKEGLNTNLTTITINGHTYRAYRIKNTKDTPIAIEAWMVNDRLWRF